MSTAFSDAARHQSVPSPPLLLPPNDEQTRMGSLAPAAVLPEQFYAPAKAPASAHGALALMRAVLDDALWCWQKHFTAKSQRERRLACEAESWFFSEDVSWPFAFINICAALGLEPNYVRQGLHCWRRAPLLRASRGAGHAVVSKQRRLRVAA